MRRLASALFTLLVAATPAMAQPYADQPSPYEVDVDLDASIYTDVSVAPLGEEIPDVSVFYDRLSPYGTWVDDAVYGYVFAPAETNYVPYSNGHWKLTDFGWTWIAADQHGWATGHYGRWVWRDRWVWRPDTTWGPAWVQWRESDSVVGWAPLGYDVDAYVPETNWRFIPTIYITSTDVSRYYVRADVARYVRDTRPIVRWNRHNDRRWVAGPDRAYLERNKVRVERATYQPREVGRFDAAERRQLEQRAAEAKVKYRARVTRDAQVRSQLETKRATVERKQVEQHRQRVRQQPQPPRKQVEVQRQTEQRERAEQAKKQQVEVQRQTEQRERAEQAKKQQVEVQQKRQTEQRNQQRQNVEKQKTDQRAQQQRARQQVEEKKLADKQHEQNERRQLDDKKQQAQQRQTQQRETVDQRREQAQQQREQKQKVEQQPKARSEERRKPSPPASEQPKKDDRGDRKKK